MFKIINYSLILFLCGCVSSPSPDAIAEYLKKNPVVGIGQPPVKKPAEKPIDVFTAEVSWLLQWVATLSGILALGFFAFSFFGHPRFAHLAAPLGMLALSCMLVLYSIPWWPILLAICFWGCVVWGAVKIVYLIRERDDEKDAAETLALHFDDPEGNKKLTGKAFERYGETKK